MPEHVWRLTPRAPPDAEDPQAAFLAWIVSHVPPDTPVLEFEAHHLPVEGVVHEGREDCPTGIALRDAIRAWEERIDARAR